jgi:hypothetical protein
MRRGATKARARAAWGLALGLLSSGCGPRPIDPRLPPAPEVLRAPEERAAIWGALAAEAARRANEACAYYAREAFLDGHAGRFEPERHGPCLAPAEAVLHARIADLALVAASHARREELAAEGTARAELVREISIGVAPSYVTDALGALDAPFSRAPRAEGCELARARVIAHVIELAVQAKADALSACPRDASLPVAPSAPYLVPYSRCGERAPAQVHTTVAHALLLAASLGASPAGDETLGWVSAFLRDAASHGELPSAPGYATDVLRCRTEIEGTDRCEATAAWLPRGWERHASLRRVPGTGLVLRLPRSATLGDGFVELGGELDVRVAIAGGDAEAVLAALRGGARRYLEPERREAGGRGLWVVRTAPGEGQESGVVVVAELPDTTAVLTAGHFLPVAAGVWDRVVELMASVDRAEDAAPFVPADLGFGVEAPGLSWVSFEPGRVRFTDAPASEVGPRFSASLAPGAVMRPEQDAFCEPGAALELPAERDAEVLVHRERTLAGTRGCEVAALVEAGPGLRVFEYVAFAFFADHRAELRVRMPLEAAGDAARLLERARAFVRGFVPTAPRPSAEAPR